MSRTLSGAHKAQAAGARFGDQRTRSAGMGARLVAGFPFLCYANSVNSAE